MRVGLAGGVAAILMSVLAHQVMAADATASESKLAGFKFPTPAEALADDGTYRQTLDGIAAQQKLKCGDLEAFGWKYDDKDKGQALVDATIKAMTDSGYKIKAITYKPLEGRQAFPGLATGKKKQIMLIWVADTAAASLVMCDAKPADKK